MRPRSTTAFAMRCITRVPRPSPPRSPLGHDSWRDGPAVPARRRAGLRGVHAHRRGDGPAALQVLAQHGHGGHLRRRRCGRRVAGVWTRRRSHMRWRWPATFAAGLQQAFRMDSMSKPLHAGRAAEAGLLAAQLARRGVTRFARRARRRRRPRPGDEHGAGLDRDRRDAGQGLPHHPPDVQEPHRLRPHVPCHRRRARTAAPAWVHASQRHRRVHVATYKPALDIACYERPATANEARFSLHLRGRLRAGARQRAAGRLRAGPPARPGDTGLDGAHHDAVDPEIDAVFPGQRAARMDIETARRPALHPPAARPQGRPRAAAVRRRTRRQADRTGLTGDRHRRSACAARALWTLDTSEGLP